MFTILKAFLGYFARLPGNIARGWDRFFFTPKDPIVLAILRILVGTIVLYIHVTAASEVLNFVGPDAWIDEEALSELATLANKGPRLQRIEDARELSLALRVLGWPVRPADVMDSRLPTDRQPLQSELDALAMDKAMRQQHGFSI